jgi:hypothetical protein
MAWFASRSPVCALPQPIFWLRALASAILLLWLMPTSFAIAQSNQQSATPEKGPSSVRGTVLNRLTHEPIARALVYSQDQQYATMTDSIGHFEFKFLPRKPEPAQNLKAATNAGAIGPQNIPSSPYFLPTEFLARKPGFLQDPGTPYDARTGSDSPALTIYLDPESLIIGHVSIPGLEGYLRFDLQLYRRDISGGREHWNSVRAVTTWTDGEFRFFDLAAGTYKLVTEEQLDRDPLTAIPGGQLFGYPPVFFPGVSDFAAAGAIQLAAGATFQANVSPARRQYYPVKIPVANPALGQLTNIRVYPLGHPGPGYSLGYDSAEQLIQGSLPDGSYTLQAETQGQPGSAGILNFSVRGAPLDGPAFNLIPNASLLVNVREEFESAQSVFVEGTSETSPGSSNIEAIRQVNLQVILTPIEEFGLSRARSSEPIQGTRDHAVIIQNVSPGRYRVEINSGVGYAASALSGGTDVLHEPLIVGMGGAASALQVTLRDDGASVDGTVENEPSEDPRPPQSHASRPSCYIYFLPVAGSSAQFRQSNSNSEGTFSHWQLPPGSYLVLAFDRAQNDLEYSNTETVHKLESKGQVIHVEPGDKAHLHLTVVPGSNPR